MINSGNANLERNRIEYFGFCFYPDNNLTSVAVRPVEHVCHRVYVTTGVFLRDVLGLGLLVRQSFHASISFVCYCSISAAVVTTQMEVTGRIHV